MTIFLSKSMIVNLKMSISYKCLGVLVDNELNWHKHVKNVIQNVFCKMALLRRVKPLLGCFIP